MNEPKPPLDPLAKRYERPTKRWVCGHACEGAPCPFGPNPAGQCQTTSECHPHKQGSRWQCSRPDSRGGPCADGPLPDGACGRPIAPCQPVRSLRQRRRRLGYFVAALSLGIVGWLSTGSWGWNFQEPGPLTFQHGTATHSCEACHAIPLGTPAALLHSALHPPDPNSQNRLCLNCHDLGSHAVLAHGLPVEEMRARTEAAHALAGGDAPLLLAASRKLLGTPKDNEQTLRCGLCHAEHQGGKFDLRAMDNQRCQVCHTNQFSSLAQGHPEFRDYPSRRRTPIFFDHESHFGRHFVEYRAQMPNAKVPEVCADCHEADGAQRMMLVRNFNKVCANCHLDQIVDVTLGGIDFLNVPALDVDTLRRYEQESAKVVPLAALSTLPMPVPTLLPALAGLARDPRLVVQPPFAIGEWPAAAADDLTPFMRLLLSANPDFVTAQAALRGLDLRDLRRATPRQIAAVGMLVWNVKELYFEIIQEGDRALARRITQATTPPPTQEQLTLLIADLPASGVRLAQQRGLPTLLEEVPAYRAGLPLPAPLPPSPIPALPGSPLVRWRADSANCTIQYLPRRHTDLFLQNWLDLAGQRYTSGRAVGFAAIFDQLASPYSPGRCAKCHSVEASAGQRIVSWFAARPKANEHAFTTFAHGPHFSLLGDRQCQHCHELQLGSKYEQGFRKPDHTLNLDPKAFASNFQNITKANCAQCHVAGGAGDRCISCHNYHIGNFSPFRTPRTLLQGQGKPAP